MNKDKLLLVVTSTETQENVLGYGFSFQYGTTSMVGVKQVTNTSTRFPLGPGEVSILGIPYMYISQQLQITRKHVEYHIAHFQVNISKN